MWGEWGDSGLGLDALNPCMWGEWAIFTDSIIGTSVIAIILCVYTIFKG